MSHLSGDKRHTTISTSIPPVPDRPRNSDKSCPSELQRRTEVLPNGTDPPVRRKIWWERRKPLL